MKGSEFRRAWHWRQCLREPLGRCQGGRAACACLDLFVRAGDMAEAFVKLRQAKGNFCYVGFCEAQDEETYVQACGMPWPSSMRAAPRCPMGKKTGRA